MEEKRELTENQIKEVVVSHEKKAEAMLKDKEKTKKTVSLAMDMARKAENIPFIGKYVADIFVMCDCIIDYIKGNYKKILMRTVITILAAIIYIVNPGDILPDILPIVGHMDDAGVIAFVVKIVRDDLNEYKAWKASN